MPWDDPLDPLAALIAALERELLATSSATDARLPTVAEMQDDFCAIQEVVGALLFSSDPAALARAEADPRVQRALANLANLARGSGHGVPGPPSR